MLVISSLVLVANSRMHTNFRNPHFAVFVDVIFVAIKLCLAATSNNDNCEKDRLQTNSTYWCVKFLFKFQKSTTLDAISRIVPNVFYSFCTKLVSEF